MMSSEACSSVYSSQKRPRCSTESNGEATIKDGSQSLTKRRVCRPGVPAVTSCSSFRVADKPSPPSRPDDKDGHYVYELGENLGAGRYKILSKMGEGTFGRVLECWDRKCKNYVAIKIVRNIEKYRHAAMIELEVLHTLERNDPEGRWHCVVLREWFDYRGHVCMVFEKLGPSLFDFLRLNDYQPFPIDFVQSYVRQLLESVAYMHGLSLIHTDLKPENILLANQESMPSYPSTSLSCIKLIDFGSSTFEDAYHSAIVSTRHYRAPEVVLGLGWSYPCDLWSVGCILVELLTGDALFQTHENLEHLAMMEQVLGPLPISMVASACRFCPKYFLKGRLNWPEGAPNKKSIRAVKKLPRLRAVLESQASTCNCVDVIYDLLCRLLTYEPATRLSARQALYHPFFLMQLRSGGAPLAQGASLCPIGPIPVSIPVTMNSLPGSGVSSGSAGHLLPEPGISTGWESRGVVYPTAMLYA